MRSYWSYIVVALFFICHTKAQTIQLSDEYTHSPIPFATSELQVLSTHERYYLKSDSTGLIHLSNININHQTIVLHVFCFGYVPYKDTLKVINHPTIIYLKKLEKTIDEIVITGEAIPVEKEKSIYQVKIIGEEKINKMASQNLREILSNETNIRLSQDNILGSSASMMGLSGQAVKMMIDGVPVIGRLNGNIDLSQINLNNVQKIEIIEGPMAVKYGTDAMGGVINIITKKTSKNKLNAKILAYYESNGTYNTNISFLFTIKKHRLNISTGRNFFDGWRPDEKSFYVEKTKMADTTRYKIWKPKEQYYLSLSDNIQIKKTNLILYSDFFDETIEDKGKPRSPYYETAIDNFYKTWRDNQKINFTASLPNKDNIDIIAARNYYKRLKNSYYNELTTLEKNLTNNKGDQDTSIYQMYMSRGTYSSKLFSNTYEIGYDIYTEMAYSSIIDNRTKQQSDFAGFLSYNIELKNKFKIKPSIRWSYNSLYQTPIIPSLHIMHALYNQTTDSTHTSMNIRLSYSRGFRTPSLKELFLNFIDINHNIVGNSQLNPELSNFYNLSLNFNSSQPHSEFNASISSFYNNVFNLIQLVLTNNTSNQYSYLNIDKMNTMGANINIKYNYRSLQANLSVSYIGLNYYTVSQSSVLFYPESVFNFSYKIKKINSQINLFSKYNGKLPYYTSTDIDHYELNYTKDYTQIDINYSLSLWKEKIDLLIGIKNLLDNSLLNYGSGGAHSSSGMYISTGRTYFLQCILNIKK